MKVLLQTFLLLVLGCTTALAHAHDDELSEEILSAGEELVWEAPFTLGHALFPVKGGGHIISVFGDPRPSGRRHEGVDIGGSRGRSILAAWPGVVVYSGWDRLGGWAVKIRHGNGLSTYYAHLNSKSGLRGGQQVNAGDLVGPMGNSGNASGTVVHLHFGVYSGRSAVNPLRYISKGVFALEGEG